MLTDIRSKLKNIFLKFIIICPIQIWGVVQPPLLIGPEDIFQITPNEKSIKEKKSSKPPTKWGGYTLTQTEKKFQGVPMTVFILGGGAWILHNNIKLSSSNIEIIGEDAIKAELKGRVVVEDKENDTILTALKGDYDKLSDKVILEGNPRLVYTSKEKKKTYISAKRIIRFLEEGRTILEGQIYITSEELTIIGEDAVYKDSIKTLIMDNRPLIFSENRFLSGEKLEYNTDLQEVSLDGNAFLIQKKLEEKSKKKDTKFNKSQKTNQSKTSEESEIILVTTLSSADRMIRQSKSDLTSVTLSGNARIVRPDSEFYSDSIRNYTKTGFQGEILEATGNVIIKDLETRTNLYGNFLEHFSEKGYSHLTGNPKIEIQNEEGKTTSTMLAVEIERFEEKKEIVARGDVRIESEKSKARGEFATYYEEEEKIILEGDPSLERDGKNLHSGKIIIYPQEDRVILSEGLNVKGSE